ncbi:alpha/beta hydrolase [Bacillus salacetis]|uniref:Alpha/beta hydrolase n=1 Tax=Bacillus salacetis TaxID=2315464 RepID=A0A3A1R3Y3_9BACI|nr:alpha/beta hydrolase [Bacillus salacetis]RIW37254.1 alpha/beta hydrolase [Bacillus salacetis]
MECNVEFCSINYKEIGEGVPFIILHSMGTDHTSMEAWLERIFTEVLSKKRIYVDLPAHGCSSINEQYRGTEEAKESLMEFINKTLGEEDFYLVGMSYGAYIAQGLLNDIMDRVKGIALIVPAVHLRTGNLPDKVVLKRDDKFLAAMDEELRTAFETLFTIQTQSMAERFMSEIQPGRQLADRGFLSSNWRETEYFFKNEPFADLESIPVPALFLLGRHDAVCGYEDQFELYKKFNDSAFHVIEGAGHMLTMEKSDIVSTLIKDWLDNL